MPYRKLKRRPSRDRAARVEKIDRLHSITELWEVLADAKEPHWWAVPWNSGRNAVWLGLRLISEFDSTTLHLDAEDRKLRIWIATQIAMYELTYDECEDMLTQINGRLSLAPEKLLRVTLRARQLMLANSHGGGHGYNTLFEPIWSGLPDGAAANKIMRRARCRDVLGVEPEFDQSPIDRLRRAFYAAWDRGLYRVAYAVGKGQAR